MPPKKKARPEMVPHPQGSPVYDTEQVAEALNLSLRYIRRAIRSRRLEAKKAGKQYLITQEAIRRFWEGLPSAAQRRRVLGTVYCG
jgi:excisionase family DNA binding protein